MELSLALSLGVARPAVITGPTYDPAAVDSIYAAIKADRLPSLP